MPKIQWTIITFPDYRGYNFVVAEGFFLSFILSLLAVYHYKYHWAISILTTIFLASLLLRLFNTIRIARYLIAGFFIVFWGLLGYGIGTLFEPNSKFSVLGLVLAVLFLLISLQTHKSAFEVITDINKRR